MGRWSPANRPSPEEAREFLASKGFRIEVEQLSSSLYKVVIWGPGGKAYEEKCEHSAGYSPSAVMDFLKSCGILENELPDLLMCIQVLIESSLPPRFRFVLEDGTIIEPEASDGLAVNPAMLFIKHEGKIIVGELTYLKSKVTLPKRRKNEEPRTIECYEPYLVFAEYNGSSFKPDFKPLRKLEFIDVDGLPIRLIWRGKATSPLKTVMQLRTIGEFKKGAIAPSFKELFSEALGNVKKFIDFWWDKRLYTLSAIYSMATYFADFFTAFPFLYFYGPPGTGKTRAGKTITLMSRRGFVVTDPSEASIFRTAEAFKPTFLFDESITSKGLWKLVRAAFKAGVQVPRVTKVKGEYFELTFFDPYSPYIFASTETPEELGGSEADITRTIMITMKFGRDPSGRDPVPSDFTSFREKMYLARLTRAHEVVAAIEKVKRLPIAQQLTGREKEVWLPLLTIASLIGEDVLSEILSLAAEMFEAKKLELYRNERLIIEALDRLMQEEAQETLSGDTILQFYAKDVYAVLREILVLDRQELSEKQFERLWSTKRIGKLLSRMGFKGRLHMGIKRYHITRSELEDLKQKYFFNINTENIEKSGGFGGFGVFPGERGTPERNPPIHEPEPSEATMPGGFPRTLPLSPENPPNTPNPPEISKQTENLIERERKIEQLYRYIEYNLPMPGQLLTFMNLNGISVEALAYLIRSGRIIECKRSGGVRFIPTYFFDARTPSTDLMQRGGTCTENLGSEG